MSSFLVIQLNSQLLSCLFKSNYFHALTLTMKLAFSVFITSSTLHSYFFVLILCLFMFIWHLSTLCLRLNFKEYSLGSWKMADDTHAQTIRISQQWSRGIGKATITDSRWWRVTLNGVGHEETLESRRGESAQSLLAEREVYSTWRVLASSVSVAVGGWKQALSKMEFQPLHTVDTTRYI